MPKAFKAVGLLILFMFACSAGEIKPVAIEDGDMCSFCKMAISQKQFAAEIITEDERVLKFDDIGCMVHLRQNAGPDLKASAIFVTDHETRQWLTAEKAYFSRSSTIKTPMGSGILAFADKDRAGSDAVRFTDLK